MKTKIKIFLVAITLTFNSIAQNIGINATGADPDDSAILDLNASDKGFLITRVDTASITSPAFGLMTLAPGDSCLYMYSGTKWKSYGGAGVTCAQPKPTIKECSIDNTTEIVDVLSTTGATWMDRNLGASRKATSSTDAQAYGDLYQWGRCKDGHEQRSSGTTPSLSTTDNAGHNDFITSNADWRNPQNHNLWQGVNGVNNPCPAGYRIPTHPELDAERASWGSFNQNAAAAYSSPLKLTVAGLRDLDGALEDVGQQGYYWTSLVYNTSDVVSLNIQNASAGMSYYRRARGLSVRCIKDYVCGKDNTTEIVEVESPITHKKWMDRNLGATQAATSSDDSDAYGDLYQWGRCKDGHQDRSNTSTTATKSITDNPGHSEFITSNSGNNDWRNPKNDLLWQGNSGINNPCPTGYRLPTLAEYQAEAPGLPSGDAAGAYGFFLKLPVAGVRNLTDGSLILTGSAGYYWTSTVTGNNANFLTFDGGSIDFNSNYRAWGASVRCIKN